MKTNFIPYDDHFVIRDYNRVDPFSSFFPALAGESGRPMWMFYTNRGQCVSSFGVNNKDGSMLEFLPANKAYQATPLLGFRTFIRTSPKHAWIEPFSILNSHPHDMHISPQEIEIIEKDTETGIETRVTYFGVPTESLPILARRVSFKNLTNKKISLDLIDGLPRIVPFGMNDYLTKHMSRTIEAFAEVKNTEQNIPFFKLRMEPSDRPEIQWLESGFFSFSIFNGKRLPIIVDPSIIFGPDTAFLSPLKLLKNGPTLFSNQLKENIMPSSFVSTQLHIKPNDTAIVESYFGFSENMSLSISFSEKVTKTTQYFSEKREEMKSIANALMQKFSFRSGISSLNNYANMSFLDNVLRGGFPLSLAENGPFIHVFSRKHGDMERDYNSFQVSSNYYSQGNGNFRDVNQNRRHDLYINSRIGTSNIDFFFNHLQIDGYNPLVINPVRFQVSKNMLSRLNFMVSDEFNRAMHALTRQPVLAGDIYSFVKRFSNDPLNISSIFKEIMSTSAPTYALKHEEGFWIDHWTYNLDHLEEYIHLFPEKKNWLFFEKNDFTYYDSDHYVQPRRDKYVLTLQGQLRQYNAVVERKDKQELISSRLSEKNVVRVENGQGGIFKTSLFVKLMGLITVKFSTIDPFGAGIEMEANKPGWCDALNGAPGLFGSSSHELLELHRLIQLMLKQIFPLVQNKGIEIPNEFFVFMKSVDAAISGEQHLDFRHTWNELANAREEFRERTFYGVSGKTRPHRTQEMKRMLEKMSNIITKAEEKIIDSSSQLPTSYFTYSVDINNLPDSWRSNLSKLDWKQHRLPPFLEGAVHLMKVLPDNKKKRLYKLIQKSSLYDKKLGMYKLNASLTAESSEIGRVTVFTPGWLENESIFLHMHYKYLLEILKAGLIDEFFAESKQGIIAFRDPQTYGRSIFENSSFICSSSFPDSSLHGKGFVARLSGATVEFMSMIYTLFLGKNPFIEIENGVVFSPKPILPKEWFGKNDSDTFSLSLNIFGVPVTYSNPHRRNTFGSGAAHVKGFEWIADGRFQQYDGQEMPKEASMAFRDGKLESLTIFLS